MAVTPELDKSTRFISGGVSKVILHSGIMLWQIGVLNALNKVSFSPAADVDGQKLKPVLQHTNCNPEHAYYFNTLCRSRS